MLAEWNVELGADDPQLEIPWRSEDGSLRYLDLKRQTELLLEISEACGNSTLAGFLEWANSRESPFETAKCDTWSTNEITAEEEIFGEPHKFGSYIDLLFTSGDFTSFPKHETFVQKLATLLRHAPDISASADFIVRRCIDRRDDRAPQHGFYITFHLSGFGEDEPDARSHWAIAMKTVQHAIMQMQQLAL
jgi:hypothetical protein